MRLDSCVSHIISLAAIAAVAADAVAVAVDAVVAAVTFCSLACNPVNSSTL